jgi:hypothetical protein
MAGLRAASEPAVDAGSGHVQIRSATGASFGAADRLARRRGSRRGLRQRRHPRKNTYLLLGAVRMSGLNVRQKSVEQLGSRTIASRAHVERDPRDRVRWVFPDDSCRVNRSSGF